MADNAGGVEPLSVGLNAGRGALAGLVACSFCNITRCVSLGFAVFVKES